MKKIRPDNIKIPFRYGLMEAFTMHHTNTVYGVPCDDRFALLNVAHRLGFDAVEFGIDADYEQDPLLQDRDYQRSLRAQAEELNIESRSLCLHLLNYEEHSPASEHPQHQRKARQILDLSMQACHAIGAWVILMPFFGTAQLNTAARVETLVGTMRELAPVADSLDVCLALETSLKAPEMRQLVDRVNAPSVQVYFDTGNAAISNDELVNEVRTLGERIVQVHIKNRPAAPLLTDGQVVFPPILDALREVGFRGTLVLELPSVTERLMRENLVLLKRMVGYQTGQEDRN